MPYGSLDSAQERVLATVVRGAKVVDLGAGHCTLSRCLLELGAREVFAVDKCFPREVAETPRLHLCRWTFAEALTQLDAIEVAFLSWPVNVSTPGLVRLLERARSVAYLGVNNDAFVCGNIGLWSHLVRRQVLSVCECAANDLIVYGPDYAERPYLPHETRAMDAQLSAMRSLFSDE